MKISEIPPHTHAAQHTSLPCQGYVDESGVNVTAKIIREKYNNQSIIFERQIIQSEPLNSFNPDSVNTIRVLTWGNKIIAATVRFGAKGAYVDNIAKGGVAVNIDINTGELGEYGMRKYDVNHYFEHPDTKKIFKGTVVTDWPKVIKIVEDALNHMPYYNSVGFDIATTINGPLIIEN